MIRIFNNTNMNSKMILYMYSGLIKNVVGGIGAVESITIEQDRIVVFGIDCLLAEFKFEKGLFQ